MEAPPRKIQGTTNPIEILPNDAAKVFTHIYPALLLAILFIRFNALVEDPVSTLITVLAPLSVLQVLYVMICLPPAGSSNSHLAPKPTKPGQRKKAPARSGLRSKIVPGLISLTVAVILATPALTVLLILFGAPFSTHFLHNLLCASHMAVLAILPLVYVHGLDQTRWREITAAYLPFDDVWGATIGTCVGAWLGAIPIPLDWDREWQKWPVTIITGAYLGCVAGKVVGGTLLHGKRIEFDETEPTKT